MYIKILFSFLLVSGTAVLHAQDQFVIKGFLPGIKEPKKILLGYTDEKGYREDTTIMKAGRFSFTGPVASPRHAFLEILPLGSSTEWTFERMLNRDYQDFFMEKGTIEINGNDRMDSATIKAGPSEQDFLLLQAAEQYINIPRTPLLKKFQQALINKDTITAQKLNAQLMEFEKEYPKAEDRFIHEHPASWVSMDLLQNRSAVLDLPTFEPLFEGLDASLKNSAQGKRITERLAIVKNTGIGLKAPDFSMKDMHGNAFHLTDTRGKYVLLDFWASWCVPCRADNPNVVKAYREFHEHNLEIVSVSLDEKQEAWLKAVQKDTLTWLQLSDLKGWKNEAAAKYGVLAIPQNFLLDPNGVIIAKNLHGEELLAKLKQILTP